MDWFHEKENSAKLCFKLGPELTDLQTRANDSGFNNAIRMPALRNIPHRHIKKMWRHKATCRREISQQIWLHGLRFFSCFKSTTQCGPQGKWKQCIFYLLNFKVKFFQACADTSIFHVPKPGHSNEVSSFCYQLVSPPIRILLPQTILREACSSKHPREKKNFEVQQPYYDNRSFLTKVARKWWYEPILYFTKATNPKRDCAQCRSV